MYSNRQQYHFASRRYCETKFVVLVFCTLFCCTLSINRTLRHSLLFCWQLVVVLLLNSLCAALTVAVLPPHLAVVFPLQPVVVLLLQRVAALLPQRVAVLLLHLAAVFPHQLLLCCCFNVLLRCCCIEVLLPSAAANTSSYIHLVYSEYISE